MCLDLVNGMWNEYRLPMNSNIMNGEMFKLLVEEKGVVRLLKPSEMGGTTRELLSMLGEWG